jgi:hypothetical protein
MYFLKNMHLFPIVLAIFFCSRDDCGFFMLKFIELWTGRKLLGALNPADFPTIRKLLTLKWLEYAGNDVEWQQILF